MVAVVSGNGLGLFNTSRDALGAAGSNGNPVVGPGHDQVFVNSTTGNLVIQSVDESLPSAGTDQQLVRTYNSQGRFDGDNDDNWRIGGYRSVQLNGSMNDPASTITKTFGDCAEIVYRFVSPGVYQSTDGDGAHDTISYDPGTSGWIWTEGSSLISETYDSQGRMVSERDAGNNVTTYQYLGSKLELIMGGGGYIRLTYTGDNLTKVYYQPSGSGEYGTSLYYEYDSLNRLTKVSLDYWALDDSIEDGFTYVSEYRYAGDTHLISEVFQHAGNSPTVLASEKFTYELNAGLYRIKTVTDGEGRVTTFNYSQPNNPSGTDPIQAPAAPAQLYNTETHTEPRTFTLNGASLTTPVTGWGIAALLESASGAIIEPKVAFDANGNGFAVWVQGNDVLTRRYMRVNDTWAAAVTLDSNNNAPTSPTLAVDAAGNAVIAWSQSNGSAVSAYGNRYDSATGNWGTATLLESTTQVVATTAYSMSAAIDGANAAVAFLQSDGTRNNLYVTRYSGGSWGAATLVEARTNVAAQPSLDIDGLGNIAVVFQQSDGTANSTYVNRYRVSNGTWAGASLLESSGAAIIEPKVMFDSSGNGIAVWAQGTDIISRRYTRSTDTWAAAVTLETNANTASAPTLAMDAAGNAVVAWAQSNGSAVSAYANRFNVTTGTWTGAALLETTNQVVDATAYSIGASINGTQAAVAFLQSDGTRNNVYVTRLTSGGTWGTATLVESRTNVAAQPIVSIDSLGNTAVVFQQSDGTANSIYVNRNVADARPYYIVPSGTNWQNVATAVYQNVTSPNAGAVLAARLTGQALTAGNRLVGFDPTLTADVQVTDNVAPYFIVTVADWVEITNTLYGTRDPNAVLALKGATGQPNLSVNMHLAVPTTLTYSPQGSVTIPAGNPAVSTAGTITTTEHPGLIANAPTNSSSVGMSAVDAFENRTVSVSGGALIARNAAGNGFAVWGDTNSIYVRRYSAATQSWSADSVLATYSNYSGAVWDLKVDDAGNAVIAWTNWNATWELHALTFSAATGTWSPDTLVAAGTSYGVGYGASISASIAAGRAAFTYLVKEGGVDRLHVARFSGGSWTTGPAVDSSTSDVKGGNAVIDAAGNVTVVWEQRTPNNNSHVHWARWDTSTSTWSTSQLLNENTYMFFSGYTQLGLDAAGNVFATYNLSSAIILRRFDVASHAWQTPVTINGGTTTGAYGAKIAVTASGDAIVAFMSSGTDMSYVSVRRYSAATQAWGNLEIVSASGSPEWPSSHTYDIRSVELVGRFAAVSWTADTAHYARFADGQWAEEPGVNSHYAVSSLDSGGNQEFLYVTNDAGTQSVFHRRFSAPYLTIPSGANWQSLANTLYGINSVAAGNALRDALGNPPLTAGNRLEGLPQSLAIESASGATVTPYYTVQAGDTWQTVALAVYGQTSVAIAAALRRAAGEPALIAGHAITVPATLYFGADLTYLSTDVVDPLGNTSTYVVDAQGRLTATRSPLVDGQRIELAYGYDAEGNLTLITQDVGGLNRVTNFYYDSHGNLQRSRDSLGNTVVRGYDAANQVIAETHFTGTDPDGAGPQDPAGGQTTHYVYDSYLHLLRFEISPLGRVTEYRYTGFWGRQLESTRVYTAGKYSGSDFSDSALGTWASQQDLTKLELIKYQFGFNGLVGTETRYAATDANGNGLSAGQSQTTYMYNGRGVVTYTAGPVGSAFLGITQAMTSGGVDALNRAGSVSQRIDSGWTRLETTYDDTGHVQRVRDTFNPLANPADSYNFMNQAGEITRSQRLRDIVNYSTPIYDTTNYTYDAGGRLRMATDPAGIRSYYLYDSLGRKVGDIDAAGRLSRQVYDHANELVATIRYSSLLSATALASLVDAQGKPTNVDINDLVASLASVPGRDASKDQFTRSVFDAAGRLVYTIDPTGAVTKTNYDGTGRVTGLVAYATRVSIPDSVTQVTIAQLETVGSAYKVSVDVDHDRVTRNIHDKDGLLVATLDGEGYLTEFEFDAGGRLLARHSWATPTNPLLRATGTTDELRPAADPRDIHVHHMYDGEGRDIAVIDAEGFLTENVYDDASNLAQVIRYGNAVTWTSIATLDSLRSAATSVNHVTSYRYDGLRRVVQETSYEGTINTASYDGRGNLLTATAASGTSDARTVSKRYDAMGHLIAELTAEGSAALASGTDYQTAWDQYATHYQYDSIGHRISNIDPQGNRTLYFYDLGGELRFTLIDHGDGKGELTETRYDALGQQTTRVAYSALIDTASLTGGLVDSTLLSRAAAAFDVVHDQVITIKYERNGQVDYIDTSNETPTDADNARNTFHYNAFGEVTSQEERIDGATRLREHSYGFDRRGLQTSIAWEPGTVNQTQVTEYDAFGRATRVTDQYNNVTRVEYDRLGRVVTTYDALNQSRSVSYDAFSRVFSSTDALQKTTSYSYDDAARSVTITTPELISVTTTHNREGQTLAITDSLGLRNGYEYDANGQLKRSYDAVSDLETRFYDRAGRLTDSHDGNNVVTHFAYDAANRALTRTSDYGGLALQTVFAYDGQGRVTRVTEPGGRITDTSYYGDGRVRDVTVDPDGLHIVTHYDYDLTGNAIKVITDATGAKPRISQYKYDDLGRRTDEIIDPTEFGGPTALNLHTQFRYDRNGNRTRKIDGENASTWYVYDAAHRLIQTIDALGGVTSLSYDAEGRIIESRRHANPAATSAFGDIVAEQIIALDVRDRVTRSFYDADSRERFTVATLGATVSGTNVVERGVVTERTFDVHGKVTQTRVYRNDIGIPSDADTGDIAGLLSVDTDDRIASALYDERGRAVFTIDVYRGITRNRYDAADQLIRTTSYAAAPDGSVELTVAGLTAWGDARAVNAAQNALDHTQAFWYDTVGRVRFSLDAVGHLKETRYLDATREVVDYAYATLPTGMDAYSAIATVLAQAAASVDTARDRSTTTLRDAASRVVKVTQVVDYQFDGVSTPASTFEQYKYDGVGNKRSYRNANGDVWTYDYDANGRLTAEFSPEVWVTTVEASGNDLIRGREFVSIVTRITYDNLGNVETRTEGIRRTVSSGAENLTGSRTTIYGYDALGRQTSVTHPQVMVYSAPSTDAQNVDINDQLKETLVTPTTTTTYNTLGDAITNEDVSGAVSRKAYDELGRLRFEVDALGYVTEYTFDNFGNAIRLTRHGVALGASAIAGEWTASAIDAAVGDDNTDRSIFTEYDRLNRRTRVTQPSFISYTPDEAGLLPGIYVQAFAESKYEYDAFGQLIRERKLLDQERGTYADTWFVYENSGRRRYTVDALRFVTEDQFDAFGNLSLHDEYATALGAGTGPWTIASVQAALDPTLHDEAHPNGIDRKTTYVYDSLGRLRRQEVHEVEFKTGSGALTALAFGIQRTNFEYDAVGNRTKVTDHYGAETFTYYDVLGRIRAIVEPPRSADTNGDYFTESGITPMTEMNRNVYGDVVEQVRYGSNPTLDSNGNHVAPTGGTVQRLRMLLDNYGHVKRSQDGTLAPDGSLSTKFFSYNVRGDVAKEWQIFTDADNAKFVQSVIRQYDALGRETLTIQPQLRSDTVPLTPTTYLKERQSFWSGGTNSWMYDNKVNAYWDPSGLTGTVRVYLFYTRERPGNGGIGDTEIRSLDVSGSSGLAVFIWDDNLPFPNPPGNGSISSIQRIEVYAVNAQGQTAGLLRSSNGNPPGPVTGNAQVAYVQTRYNVFGEITERGVSAAPVADNVALQEYWKYDDAGHVWKTNADGVDRVFLYDVAGRVTADIRNQQDNFIRNLTDAAGAYYATDRMMTETLYNSLDQATSQRMPTFAIDERLEAAAPNISIGLVGTRVFLQWAGTDDPSLKTTFQFYFGSNGWTILPVVPLSPGVLGVDVTDYARATVVKWNFQITKSLSLQFAPFASSSGTFYVLLGETVTFGIESTDNPRVATPVIGPGAPLTPTTYLKERQSFWSGGTNSWMYDNKVNAYWDPSGLTGTVRVYLFYTRERPGNGGIGDTEIRSLDVSGSSGLAVFIWDDNLPFPNPPGNGSIWSIQRIEVYALNGQSQPTVLLRSSAQASPSAPVRMRWVAPPANLFANALFYYKRSDAVTWSNGITPTLSAGKLEVDVDALLTDDTIYDYRIEYWQQNTGILLARKEGQIDTTNPTITLLSASDVYPTAIYLPPPYQVGGVHSSILRWDSNPEPDSIVEFRLTNAQGTTLVNTLSPDKHQIDLSGFTNAYTYELTFRRPSQPLPYARVSGGITIGRDSAFIEMSAVFYAIPVQPQTTPYVQLNLDRWGNVVEQIDGAIWDEFNVTSGQMDRHDVPRLKTKYTYNVFGQQTSVSNDTVRVLDTRSELDPNRDIPDEFKTVTSTNYYDLLGRQVGVRDENGNVNGITLNLAGQITGEQHADLGTKSFMYDAFGRQIQVQDEIGWRVRSIYDAANRQIGVQTEYSPEVWLSREFTYDELGRRIAETSGAAADAGGEETTQYFFDLAGNLIRRRSELNHSTTYTYDVEDHKTSERDAIGGLMRFEYDHFGKLQHKWDLSNERTDYDYNGAGLLDSTTSTRANLLPNQMDYEYDGAGHLVAVIDNATNRRVDYGYDTWGRMRRERTMVDGVLHQDTQSSFDSMNRLAKVVDLRYSLEYYYDAHGNRTLMISNYLDHVHTLHTDNLWYTYDEMNRVKLSEGTRKLENGLYLPLGLIADGGTYSEYYQNGQRHFTEQFGKGVLTYHGAGSYTYEAGYYRESYEYDGAGRLHAIWRSGTAGTTGGDDQVELRKYDDASRLIRTEQRRVDQSNTHFEYDDDGRMYQQLVRQSISDAGAKTSQTDFVIDAAGVQRSYLTTTFIASGGPRDTYSYNNTYRLADGYLLSKQDVQLTKRNDQGTNPNTFIGTVERFYDVNNNVVSMRDSNAADGREFRYLANSLQGEVITAIETDSTDSNVVRQAMKTAVEGNANLNFAQHFFHAQGQSVGSLGQLDGTLDGVPQQTQGKKARFFGIAMFGDSWAGGAARRPIPLSGRLPDGSTWQPPKPATMNANFDVNFTDIGGFQASASDVVVQQGDTLRSIAARLFGDGNLWYLLADQNGFTTPDGALPTGTNLRVPNQVYSLANTASIFKPFDPNSALGDKQPSLIDPTPPLPKQPCGGHAKLILTIIAVVVTIIVAYFMGPASGPVAAFFQGLIAGAAGNAVSQGVAIGMGLQEGFDWKQAAVAGVSGGFGGIIAPAVGQLLPNSPIAAGLVSGALGNAVTQGASILLDLQESFSWRDLAMSAASGAANAAIANYAPSSLNEKPKTFLGDFGKSLVTGTTSSVVQAAFGGKIDGIGIVTDAFGTALGNSIIRGLQGPPKPGAVMRGPENSPVEGADDELAEVVVTARRQENSDRFNLGLDKNPDWLEKLLQPSAVEIESVRTAKSGDYISKLLGTSDPGAIGAFMRANGLTDSTIYAGRDYIIPSGSSTAADAQYGQQVLNSDNAVRARRAEAAQAAAGGAIVSARMAAVGGTPIPANANLAEIEDPGFYGPGPYTQAGDIAVDLLINRNSSLLDRGVGLLGSIGLAIPYMFEQVVYGALNAAPSARLGGQYIARGNLAETTDEKVISYLSATTVFANGFNGYAGVASGFVPQAPMPGLAGGGVPLQTAAEFNAARATYSEAGTTGTPPSYVFRGVAEPPTQIFEEGFTARGTSTDLRLHQIDNTSPPSAYVGTSESSSVGIDFATMYGTRDGNMYVVARPANGIDINATLGRNSVHYNEFEIAIPERVLPQDIRAVTPVNADGTYVGYSTLNPGFRPR